MKSEKFTDNYLEYVKETCIHCKKCTKVCPFLQKYGLNLASYADRKDLAYSCFYCRKCKDVCPVDLDGRIISQIQREIVQKPMTKVKLLKGHFFFRNKLKKTAGDIFFPGCNFSAFFPKTTEKIVNLFLETGNDFDFDCCSYPVKMTGDMEKCKISLEKIEKRFAEKNIKRVVLACPNCYHFFNEHVNFEIISIYKWLEEKGLGTKIEEKLDIYFPCPDRYSKIIFRDIKKFVPKWEDSFKEVNCCGHGGLASGAEPEISKEFRNHYKNKTMYTYCATCANTFGKNNETHHIVSMILAIDEKAENKYVKNSAKLKFKGHNL